MKNNILRFLFLVTFVIAQFFTQQMHQLTHLLSDTKCDPEIVTQHSLSSKVAFESHEKHEHCKFLQIISTKHVHPFEAATAQAQLCPLHVEKLASAKTLVCLSYSDSSYHKARAPPLA